jgi:hypothetical protein
MKKYTRKEWRRWKSTLETSGEDEKVHSKRVEKMKKYTRNEWINQKKYTRSEWRTGNIAKALQVFEVMCSEPFSYKPDLIVYNSLLDGCARSKQIDTMRVWKIYTRFECIFQSFPLVSSIFFDLLHSFRVYFLIFSTRSECIFWSSPLVSSVVSVCLSNSPITRTSSLTCYFFDYGQSKYLPHSFRV